jgi:cytochrome P450
MFQLSFYELFRDGIFGVDGEKWIQQRKLASNSFKVNDIKRSLTKFITVTREAIAHLENLEKTTNNNNNNSVVDMQTLAASLTLSAFSELAMSTKLASVGNHELQTQLEHIHLILS